MVKQQCNDLLDGFYTNNRLFLGPPFKTPAFIYRMMHTEPSRKPEEREISQ
jgi:hypothetical protein